MAGLYIKDAKLPDACWNCGWDPCMLWHEDRGDLPKHPNCPLVEVPDHGDLIDRDEAIKEICRDTFPNFSLAVQRIKSVSVIIPAENTQNDLEVVE